MFIVVETGKFEKSFSQKKLYNNTLPPPQPLGKPQCPPVDLNSLMISIFPGGKCMRACRRSRLVLLIYPFWITSYSPICSGRLSERRPPRLQIYLFHNSYPISACTRASAPTYRAARAIDHAGTPSALLPLQVFCHTRRTSFFFFLPAEQSSRLFQSRSAVLLSECSLSPGPPRLPLASIKYNDKTRGHFSSAGSHPYIVINRH